MKKLLLGISSGIFYTFLSVCISLFTVPVFLNFLSRQEFGVFYLINSLIVWTGLLNVGLRGSFKLQISTAIGKGEQTQRLMTTFLLTQCFIALVIACLGIVLSFFVSDFLTLSFVSIKELYSICVLLSLSFAFSFLSNGFAVVLSVHNKDFDVYKGRSIALVFQTLVSIGLLYTHWGIIGLAIAALSSEFFFLLYVFYIVYIKFKYAQLFLSLFDRQILLYSLSIGKWFLAGFLAQLLIRNTDLFLIGKLADMNQVTQFIISSKLYWMSSTFLLVIIKIVSPQLIKLKHSQYAAGYVKRYSTLFVGSFSLITVLFALTIYMVNGLFIRWWIGGAYYLGDTINFMLMLTFVFSSFNIAIRTLLLAKHQLKAQKISALAEGALHLALTIILGIYYGLNGIVAGITLASALACVISFVLNSSRFQNAFNQERILI